MIDIYRGLVPAGTNPDNICMEQVEILVGTYDDAYEAAKPYDRTSWTSTFELSRTQQREKKHEHRQRYRLAITA